MTDVRLRTVDAFTDRPFTGNPAAVLVLDDAPSDEWMAAVARETGVSETAFVVREELADAVGSHVPPTTEVGGSPSITTARAVLVANAYLSLSRAREDTMDEE